MLNLEAAEKELSEKSYTDIQSETTWKWASRAAVAYLASVDSEAPGEKLAWYLQGTEYAHEAIEHAALIEDKGKVLSEVQTEIEPYATQAYEAIALLK
jgi:hypothetical protein